MNCDKPDCSENMTLVTGKGAELQYKHVWLSDTIGIGVGLSTIRTIWFAIPEEKAATQHYFIVGHAAL